MALSDYLAQRYLNASTTADPSNPRKRKRKPPKDANDGLIIADDDASIFNSRIAQDDDEDGPLAVVSGQSAEFRKSKESAWKTVASAPTPQPKPTDDADAFLLTVAQEDEERRQQAEEGDAPTIVPAPAFTAGLQTGAQMAEQIAAKRTAEMAAFAAERARNPGKGQQTVYRDASGRIVDVAMKRAEARRQAEEEERATRERERETLEGRAQVMRREEMKRELEDVAVQGVARTKDDAVMNMELKARSRWGDPMAGMVLEDDEGGGEPIEAEHRAEATGRKSKVYRGGGYEPNRYGIAPGHRWDGVDRGNGFERKWFDARSRKKKNEERDYAWQIDE